MPWDDVLPSRVLGGFEGSTMQMADGRRVDCLSEGRHAVLYERDYDLVLGAGVRGVRESLRWHRMQPSPSLFDGDELVGRLRALQRRGMQAIWSLTQFGVPDWVDVWSPAFPSQFAAFARSVAELHRDTTDTIPVWSPVNEISYWAWAGGSGDFAPVAHNADHALKRQLAAASIAASRALRAVDPRCRLIHIDPLVNIVAEGNEPASPEQVGAYEAWDMLRGTLHPELGGAPELLDIVGVSFYPHNQRLTDGTMIPPHDSRFVPFQYLVEAVAERYGRPILVAETGTEGDECAGWLRYVAFEIEKAAPRATLVGLCLYPILDYPGWADSRHCECGLIGSDSSWAERWPRPDMQDAVRDALRIVHGRWAA